MEDGPTTEDTQRPGATGEAMGTEAATITRDLLNRGMVTLEDIAEVILDTEDIAEVIPDTEDIAEVILDMEDTGHPMEPLPMVDTDTINAFFVHKVSNCSNNACCLHWKFLK